MSSSALTAPTQLYLDLIGPQLVMFRLFDNNLIPYKKGVRGSKLTTFDERWKHGGIEINTFPATKWGFDQCMKQVESKPCAEAWIGRLENRIDDPVALRVWVRNQFQLKAFKRIK